MWKKDFIKIENKTYSVISVLVILLTTSILPCYAQIPPYPPSPVITSITWDNLSNIVRAANGSDNFPMTWASDGHQYTAWGDGKGFQGPDAGLGVARISGPPESFTGTDLLRIPRSFEGGKSYGIVAIDGKQYMWVGPNSGKSNWSETWIRWTDDNWKTWQRTETFFTLADKFPLPTFLNFGQDYAGARDTFVYFYAYDVSNDSSGGPYEHIHMGRVQKADILTRSAYEFFNGLDGDGNPIWSSSVGTKQPVFSDSSSRGVGLVSVTYHPQSRRYLLVTTHGSAGSAHFSQGGLGIFDAPKPWGPWTTVEYTDLWMGSTTLFFADIATKQPDWLSADGRTFHLIFTGYGGVAKDSYNHLRGVFNFGSGGVDTISPASPIDLEVTEP
jgi:hypothetical protein